jgi:hypothetical protein
MLDQPYMTDLIEANSMGHEPNLIDIYSASWGPTDDGKTVDGPRNATMRAIVRGVNEVRCVVMQLGAIVSGVNEVRYVLMFHYTRSNVTIDSTALSIVPSQMSSSVRPVIFQCFALSPVTWWLL